MIHWPTPTLRMLRKSKERYWRMYYRWSTNRHRHNTELILWVPCCPHLWSYDGITYTWGCSVSYKWVSLDIIVIGYIPTCGFFSHGHIHFKPQLHPQVYMANVPWDGAQVMVPISASELYNGVEQKIFVFQRRLGPGMAGKHPPEKPWWMSGWWFGTWILFSIIYGIVLPIDELIFFKWLLHHQPDKLITTNHH